VAPPSVLEVCNRALSLLGNASVSSLDDGSVEARELARVYDGVRRGLLRRGAWSFAIARAELAASAAAPAFGWDAAYPLPSDYVRLVQVGAREGEGIAYHLEGRSILTNEAAPLPVRYVRDETDAATFDAAFCDCLALALAHACCERLTQSRTRKGELAKELDDAWRQAKRVNAVERAPMALPELQPWNEARFRFGADAIRYADPE
jgi:hypothetical protein